MSDDTNPKPPVEIIPSVQGGVSAVGSANAPFLYFEAASTFGILHGVIQITLEAQRVFPTGEGSPVVDRVVVAHLRMSIRAAITLKNSIDGALLLAAPTPQAKN